MDDFKYDIDKYLKGELTPSQMHALEKRALSDPFLADAIEGSEQISDNDRAADMKLLEAALKNRIQQKEGRMISLWVWPARIAAGLLFIVVSTYFIVTLTTREQDDLALTEKESAPVSPDQTKEGDPVAVDSVQDVYKNQLSLAKEEQKSSEVSRAKAPVQQSDVPVTESVPESPVQADVEPDVLLDIAEQRVDDNRSLAKSEAAGQASKKKEGPERSSRRELESAEKLVAAPSAEIAGGHRIKMDSRIVKGQVKSEDGAELPGVNVMIQGTNIGTVTDIDGNYQIAVNDQNTSLVFSFIGFLSTEVAVTAEEQINIELNHDVSQLSEVVVVGYGSERALDENDFATFEMATPAGGRKEYKQYLEKNLHYPEAAIENNVEGKVTIQFTIETSGQLSDFRVIKGIGFGCEEEVIRIVKAGPKWTPTKRNSESLRDRVKVRMKFALPKK